MDILGELRTIIAAFNGRARRDEASCRATTRFALHQDVGIRVIRMHTNVRTIEVDMSSKAIDARMREVSQLRKLGLSIAKAKRIPAPPPPAVDSTPDEHRDSPNPTREF